MFVLISFSDHLVALFLDHSVNRRTGLPPNHCRMRSRHRRQDSHILRSTMVRLQTSQGDRHLHRIPPYYHRFFPICSRFVAVVVVAVMPAAGMDRLLPD